MVSLMNFKRPRKLSEQEKMAAFPKQPGASTEVASPKPASPKAAALAAKPSEAPPPEDASRAPPQSPRLRYTLTPRFPTYRQRLLQYLLTCNPPDPNGPLIYDMMNNRSPRWRAKNMRSSLLPPGWRMGISRLGKVPVYDPLYDPMGPPIVSGMGPPVRNAVITRPREPHTGMIRHMRRDDDGAVPRYQATDEQYNYDLDEYNMGLPPGLAALHHDWKRGRGAYGGGGGGIRTPRNPWLPPNLRCGGGVPVVVDDILEDYLLAERIIEPRDILQRPIVPRRNTFPIHGPHHRPGHNPGHHRPVHRPGHGHGHPHGHDTPNYNVFHDRRVETETELENDILQHEVDREADEIRALQREMDIQEAERREAQARVREEHARSNQERAARRAAEHDLAVRERQLAESEAERVAEELAHHGHAHGRPGHGHHGGVHPRHAEHRGPRVVRTRDGRQVVVDDNPHHRELVHIPREVIDPHHRHHENIPHTGHHSPPRGHRRPARHVHFAEDLTSSEEERLERHRHRRAQEAHPIRRRFVRDGRPYLFHEDELDYAREMLYDDEMYDSADEYYEPHQRLLMPPRRVQGNYWEEDVWTDDD